MQITLIWPGLFFTFLSFLIDVTYHDHVCFQCYDDGLLTVGNVLCCSNLMDKAPYRCRQLPAVEASTEFTQLTNKPQNNEQRQAVTRLNSALKVCCIYCRQLADCRG